MQISKAPDAGLTAEQVHQHQWDIADAKLEAVEKIAWPLSMGWAAAAWFMTHHWFPPVVMFFGVYFLVRYPYAKESARFDKMHREKVFGPSGK